MTNNKPWKSGINHLINIWLDVFLSISNDAGWQDSGLLSKIIEYGGKPPQTGYDKSNLTSMLAIRLLRDPCPEYYKINPIMRAMLQREPGPAHALLAKNYYLGLNPKTNKTWIDEDRAKAVGQTAKQFEKNLDKGYTQVAAQIEIIENFCTEAGVKNFYGPE